MHQFEVGQSYSREDVLLFLGSKLPVSGIVYGERGADYMAVFTGGRFGKRAGYPDGWGDDGTLRYCGQGSKGDQKLSGANARLAEHEGTILVFETWKPRNSWRGMQRFVGDFRLVGQDSVIAKGARKGDRLIIFALAPLPVLQQPPLPPPVDQQADIMVLRAAAIAAARNSVAGRSSMRQYRDRSTTVARYVLARAAGICESCDRPAPFTRRDGTPFLEVHHTQRLADDGPDDPLYVCGICPNCHREAHLGADPTQFRLRLEARIQAKELPLGSPVS